ncbi:MAG: carboxypeptidase regulatory-like domain-containing protein [Chitinophagales bacterium]|nr:carboxypeptidase regulatory-like domain-containing protein [Chitinophagaceae bacterium]MCB9064850.1 carboxypeptidase regulatory-like domain-containing protein [Chitinophagales bacterium]
MRKTKPIQISIPQPCNEDWNKMTPQEKGRFCDSCQKCIIDFSRYSDKELYEYLIENAGKKLCGRFRSSQLNRSILPPAQPHSTLYKWMIAAGMALVFTAVPDSPVFAQAPHTQEQISHTDKQPNSTGKNVQITGKVHSYDGAIVSKATVIISYGGITNQTTTNEHGEYHFSRIALGNHTIEAYIKEGANGERRGLVKNVPVETDGSVYVDITLSNAGDLSPFVTYYYYEEDYYLGDWVTPPEPKRK